MNTAKAVAGDDHARRRRNRRMLLVVIALTMVAPFSIDTYLPSLPTIAREFQVSEFYLQQTLSAYLIAFAVMTLVYGPLSDTFGRRAVVLVSAAAYIAMSIGCALAPNAHALVLLRIGQGIAASGGMVIGRAIIRDVFVGASAQRAMSRVTFIFGLAPAIAPIIGGWLHEVFGWRSVFWFMAALGVLVWILSQQLLVETLAPADRHPGHPRAIAIAYWRALSRGRFMALTAAVALSFGGLFLYVAGSPTILYRDLGYGAQDFGRFFVPMVIGIMSGAWISGRMAGRYSHHQAVTVGFAVMTAAALANFALSLTLAPSGVSVIAPVCFFACGMAIALPNLSLLAFELFPKNRGLAAAVQSFAQMTAGALIAGLLVPALAGHIAGFAAGMLIVNLTGLMFWWWCRSLS